MAGDAIPSEPTRQVTAEDNAEREKREAEKNATKASLNISAGAGTPAQTQVPAAGKKQSTPSVVSSNAKQPHLAAYRYASLLPLCKPEWCIQARRRSLLQQQRQVQSSTGQLPLIHLTQKTPKSSRLPLKLRLSSLGISDRERYAHSSQLYSLSCLALQL